MMLLSPALLIAVGVAFVLARLVRGKVSEDAKVAGGEAGAREVAGVADYSSRCFSSQSGSFDNAA
jgi:hypothetical protein